MGGSQDNSSEGISGQIEGVTRAQAFGQKEVCSAPKQWGFREVGGQGSGCTRAEAVDGLGRRGFVLDPNSETGGHGGGYQGGSSGGFRRIVSRPSAVEGQRQSWQLRESRHHRHSSRIYLQEVRLHWLKVDDAELPAGSSSSGLIARNRVQIPESLTLDRMIFG
jgi:hypothetical protein